MSLTLAGAVLLSALVFAALVLVRDRARGATLAQIGSVTGAVLLFLSLSRNDRLDAAEPGLLPLGIGILSATIAAMGHHLYLGRFASVATARWTFLAVALGLAAALSAIFLMLA